MERTIAFTLNGKAARVTTDDERPLLWVLRQDLGLTGTKFGCGESHCGACTVIVDKRAVRSCSLSLKEIEGKSVLTIEGLEQGERLHPIQQAFVEAGAVQCGFCTPGFVVAVADLLQGDPNPSPATMREALSGNLCRCTGYQKILDAVAIAAARLREPA